MFRPWIWPMLAFAMALLPATTASPVRARPASPARIVAIGDLHGDHAAWLAIARAAGVVDAAGRWSGGETVLVQVGDIVDRGPESLRIIRHMMKLQREAGRDGGQVIVLVGNHEAMMMTGDLRYVHPGEYAAFTDANSRQRRDEHYDRNRKTYEEQYRRRSPSLSPVAVREMWMKDTPLGMIEHRRAWHPGGELGRWTLANPAVVKIGDTLFVHGGISTAYAALPIEEINRRVADALKQPEPAGGGILEDPAGPLWYRGHVSRSGEDEAPAAPASTLTGAARPQTIAGEIDLVLQRYGARRIVIGHTPSRSGIISALNGKLWRIDSANSRFYGGTPSYLEIAGDRVTAHAVKRPAGSGS